MFSSLVEIKSFRQESDALAPVTRESSDSAPLVWEALVYFLFLPSFTSVFSSVLLQCRKMRLRKSSDVGSGRTHPRRSPGGHGVRGAGCAIFPLQWSRVSRPGLPKMEADFVSCLSPARPSTSLAYNPSLFSPSIQFHTSKRQTFAVFLGQVRPRYTKDLALGVWGVGFGQSVKARKGQNPGRWRLLDRGQVSFQSWRPRRKPPTGGLVLPGSQGGH